MPLTRITSQLISIPSNYPLTGSLNGTASYATTASFAMNGGSGGGGGTTSLTGITFPYVSGSNVYTLSQSAVAANDLLLSVNGVVQTPTTDYTVSASSVTFTDSYPSGSSVNVRYLVTATSSSFVDLANIVLTGTTTGDAYYPQVAALLHFDGTNGSTTITDNSKNNVAFTVNGDSKISTAQSKFGGASLLLDGTNDYLSTTHRTNFNVGANDFTIEAWVYTGTISQQVIFGANRDYDGVGAFMLNLNYTGKVRFFCMYSSGIVLDYNVGTGTISDSTWHHIAVTRNGSSLRIFIDGIQTGTTNTTLGSAAIDNAIADYRVGSSTDGYSYFNGYIDELRVTKGVARYTGSFTTSSVAFPNNVPVTQLQTKYVGLVGGINDSTVDYGVEKLSDTSLKIRKMTASGQPLSGSGELSASVDRVYVNVLNYKEVQTTAQSASYAVSSSYLINASAGESFHPFLLG